MSAYGHSYEVSCEIPTAVRNTSRNLREMKGSHSRVDVMKQKVESRHRNWVENTVDWLMQRQRDVIVIYETKAQ